MILLQGVTISLRRLWTHLSLQFRGAGWTPGRFDWDLRKTVLAVFRCRLGGWRCFFSLHLVDPFDQEKNGKSNDFEVDDGVDEQTKVDGQRRPPLHGDCTLDISKPMTILSSEVAHEAILEILMGDRSSLFLSRSAGFVKRTMGLPEGANSIEATY